jgi:hypothetical protein
MVGAGAARSRGERLARRAMRDATRRTRSALAKFGTKTYNGTPRRVKGHKDRGGPGR